MRRSQIIGMLFLFVLSVTANVSSAEPMGKMQGKRAFREGNG